MSRPRNPNRWTTEELPCIDLHALKRAGHLEPATGYRLVWHLTQDERLEVRLHGMTHQLRLEANLFRQHFSVDPGKSNERLVGVQAHWVERFWQSCSLGGRREVWLCPTPGCGRRVWSLYIRHAQLGCRHCFGLNYTSQRLGALDRAEQRILRLQERLGWSGGILALNNERPRGMWASTYWRLKIEHAERVEEWAQGAFGGFVRRAKEGR